MIRIYCPLKKDIDLRMDRYDKKKKNCCRMVASWRILQTAATILASIK